MIKQMMTLDNNYAYAILIARASTANKIKAIAQEYDLPNGLMGRIDSEIDKLEKKITILRGK